MADIQKKQIEIEIFSSGNNIFLLYLLCFEWMPMIIRFSLAAIHHIELQICSEWKSDQELCQTKMLYNLNLTEKISCHFIISTHWIRWIVDLKMFEILHINVTNQLRIQNQKLRSSTFKNSDETMLFLIFSCEWWVNSQQFCSILLSQMRMNIFQLKFEPLLTRIILVVRTWCFYGELLISDNSQRMAMASGQIFFVCANNRNPMIDTDKLQSRELRIIPWVLTSCSFKIKWHSSNSINWGNKTRVYF